MNWILAVDPGLNTGWSSAQLTSPLDVHAGQMPGEAFCDWFSTLDLENGLICLERFVITSQTAKKSQQTDALEVIGILKFLTRRAGGRVEMQTPGNAKSFCPDHQLRKLGLWKPGQDHARDAIRHLLLGIVSHTSGQVRDELIQSLV